MSQPPPGATVSELPDPGAELSDGLPLPDAVLWDMDGTLVDTEPHWFAAEKELMRSHGLPWSDQDCLSLVGGDLEVTGRIMHDAGLPLSPREVVDALCARVARGVREHLEVRPGALELLVALRRAGVPTALVTNSEAPVASVVVERLHGLAATSWDGPLFDVTVTGDIALPVKPDPAPYRFAARRLAALAAEAPEGAGPDLDVSRMVAVEDSPTGIAAARGSGALVVGVPNVVDLTEAGAHHLAESLETVSPQLLGQWVRRRRPR